MEFNQDPEILWGLRGINDWMGYVWLEMLKLADRGGGKSNGTTEELARTLAPISRSMKVSWASQRVLIGLRWMADRGFIEVQPTCVLVRNYGEYREGKELLKSRKRDRERDRDKDKDTSSELPIRQSSNDFPSDIRAYLLATTNLKSLADDKHAVYWKTQERTYDPYDWLYFEEEINKADAWIAANPRRKPTVRGLPAFMTNWFNKAIEIGRKIHG